MNQVKLIQSSPPSIFSLLSSLPASSSTKNIDQKTVNDFLYLSRRYLGLDKIL